MNHTLVAAFDSMAEAQSAKDALMGLNIDQSAIKLSSQDAAVAGPTTTAGAISDHSTDYHGTSHHGESFGEKISHFFGSLFGEDDHGKPHQYASAYPEAYKRGATLLTVTVATDEEVERVQDVLESSNAIDIDERSSTWTDGYSASAGVTHLAGDHQGAGAHTAAGVATTAPLTTGHNATATGTTAIPVIEEELKVGKREVTKGKVRVVTHVTERPVQESVSLHEEHAKIERTAVNREATAADLAAFKDGSIEITETAEEAVVAKNARVVEEVRVGTEATDRTETIHDTVRRTDVDVASEHAERATTATTAPLNAPVTDRKF